MLVPAPAPVILISCALLGFRHGFDYDHIAAITDIAGVEARPAGTMRLGLAYALGHAATVAVLGALVIGFQLSLPAGMDRWAERLVGLTLIVLAIYVLGTLLFGKQAAHADTHRPHSRAALIIAASHWLYAKLHTTITGKPSTPRSMEVTGPTCFGIGIIHGLGAETPTQLSLFLLAANLGGPSRGLLGLSLFLFGLLSMNTLMTASVAGLFTAGRNWRAWTPILTGLTAAYSLCIGTLFLLGHADILLPITG